VTRDPDAGDLTGDMIDMVLDTVRRIIEEERQRQEQYRRDRHESPAREARPEPRLSSISITIVADAGTRDG
jgi:hypothetical protein